MSDRLFPNPNTLEGFRDQLPTRSIGRSIKYFDQISSTNDVTRSYAQAGGKQGLLVLAEQQSNGRGRVGRGWTADPGKNLLMSLLLRPAWLSPNDAFAVTMLASVALCEAVEQLCYLRAGLKWPNDLMLPSQGTTGPLRKAAGILSELELEGGRIGWIIIGIGVNVNQSPSGIVDGRNLSLTATSLSAATGQIIDRLMLLRALLLRLDQRYETLRQGQRQELFEAWRNRLTMLDRTVHVRLVRGELHGYAEGVEPSGALLVRDEQGSLHTVTAGDVGG